MNYQENPPNRQVEPDENTGADRELKNLLNEWTVPEPTAALGERVFSNYRSQFHRREWWRWVAGSIRLPVPVAAMAGLLLCATSYLAVRKATTHSVKIVTVSAPTKVVEVPVPVIQERVVTRVVYAKRNAGDRSAPDVPAPIEGNKAIAKVDMTGFRPVSEIKIIVVKGDESNEK
ncbi:MAG: hypothetical protein J2P41_02560 [Blastocatellia bacterium]|nr:hypothetical protein [Blastocatellia bacterium]